MLMYYDCTDILHAKGVIERDRVWAEGGGTKRMRSWHSRYHPFSLVSLKLMSPKKQQGQRGVCLIQEHTAGILEGWLHKNCD